MVYDDSVPLRTYFARIRGWSEYYFHGIWRRCDCVCYRRSSVCERTTPQSHCSVWSGVSTIVSNYVVLAGEGGISLLTNYFGNTSVSEHKRRLFARSIAPGPASCWTFAPTPLPSPLGQRAGTPVKLGFKAGAGQVEHVPRTRRLAPTRCG